MCACWVASRYRTVAVRGFNVLPLHHPRPAGLQWLLLLAVALHGRWGAEAVVAQAGCAPGCRGHCFAGKCLFAGEDLDLDASPLTPLAQATVQPQPPASPALAASVGYQPPQAPRLTNLAVKGSREEDTSQLQAQSASASRVQETPALGNVQLPPPRFPPGGPHANEQILRRGGRAPLALRLPKEAFFGGASAGESAWRRRFSGALSAPQPREVGDLESRSVPEAAPQASAAPSLLLQQPAVPEDALLPSEDANRIASVAVPEPVEAQEPGVPTALASTAGTGNLPPSTMTSPSQDPWNLLGADITRSLSLGVPVQTPPASEAAAPMSLPQIMQVQLDRERSEEARLRAENEGLRQQLARWRVAGAQVAAREAKVVETIRRNGGHLPSLAGPAPAAPQAEAEAQEEKSDGLSLLATSMQTYVFNAGKEPLGQSANALRVLTLFFVVNAGAFLIWLCGTSSKAGQPEASRAASKGSSTGILEPMLRYLGLGLRVIEISEVQVRNLSVGGDAYVVFQVGPEPEQRSGSVEQTEAGLLRFEEAFTFRVLQGDREGKCICWVMDRDPLAEEERAARLEISVQELLRLVRRRHGEYFDFDLDVQARRHRPSTVAGTAQRGARPCLAMRVRDITNPQVTKPSPVGAQLRRPHLLQSHSGGGGLHYYGSQTTAAECGVQELEVPP